MGKRKRNSSETLWNHLRSYAKLFMASSIVAANQLSSDTDTIATMTGAILGSLTAKPPEFKIKDQDYIASEASRLHSISVQQNPRNFPYPGLIQWKPPKSQQDTVRKDGKIRYIVLGLGAARPLGEIFCSPSNAIAVWQWLKLETGQTILSKRRRTPRTIGKEHLGMIQTDKALTLQFPESSAKLEKAEKPRESRHETVKFGGKKVENDRQTIHQLTDIAIRSNFDERLIGEHLLSLIERTDAIEAAVAYAAIIAKAKKARMEKSKSHQRMLKSD